MASGLKAELKVEIDDFIAGLGDIGKAIIDYSPEGIIFADKEGNILYVNSSYTKMAEIEGSERLGKNIFLTNNEGALATALRTGKPVFRKKHRPPWSSIDVIAHAFPIYLNNEIAGAVVFIQEMSEALKLLEDLAQKENVIKTLTTKLEGIAKGKHNFDSLIGGSPNFHSALSLTRKVAVSDSTVLLRGESGTGKELFAEAIHSGSSRANNPIIKINCAAIPDNLLESEFFGFEKGSFTGAHKRKLGNFELADKGTIFLDEIGDMDLRLQAKLLQVLQNGEFRRVGGAELVKVDVRVVAATNRPLEELIEAGRFREDLYYRLNVVRIDIPPLRERKGDIQELADRLLEKVGRKLGRRISGLTGDALDVLESYHWPGNVRELENVLERAVNMAEEGMKISAREIYLPQIQPSEKEDVIQSLEDWENIMIKKALIKFGTSFEGKRKAAETLKISVTTLYNKIKKYNTFDQLSPYIYSKKSKST
ncbi:MAG: sigma 54-interacting transcriptional regulator [Clostridia bacterium]|jgi:PAS domain S-box-containing protein|nr:sigma 54-interacting transcriptional regulator [Clostridia bacterium]